MSVFRVIDKTTKRTVYAYTAPAATEFAEFPFAGFDHVKETAIREDGSIAPDPSWVITRFAFRNRFTTPEKVAIEMAALDNPSAAMDARAVAASIRAYLADVMAATFVDLQDATTAGGVRQLEAVGLIAPGRADQILLAAPTRTELYTG